jgi:dihydrofolate reductase
MSIKVNAVVAICNKNGGIGCKNTLPWRIPKDLKFFAQVSKYTRDKSKMNAVIVGRKTWFSIPKQMRPLPGRKNIVISNTITEKDSLDMNENANLNHVYICKSFPDALQLVGAELTEKTIENVYVIGGAEMYKTSFEHELFDRLYLTRVFADVECDVFMPKGFLDKFEKIDETQVDELELERTKGFDLNKVLVDNNVEFTFEIFKRI